MRLAPFDPLRPPPDKAPLVASLPYDVVTTEEARALAKDNPESYLHVVRAEIDFAEGTDPYSEAIYARARENFDALQKRGSLVRHGRRSLFAYRQTMGDHQQVGLMGCCHVDDYDDDVIKKHEKTRKAKEDDRTRHTLALRAHAGPVFLTFRDVPAIQDLMRAAMQTKPLFDFVAPDRIGHTVWEMPDAAAAVAAFEQVPVSYVADGHHRSASASRARAELREGNPDHTGDEEYNWFLAVLFPANQLQILAYNRVVADLNGLSRAEFLEKVRGVFEVSSVAAPVPSRAGRFSMYLDPDWYDVVIPASLIDPNDPVGSLDVSVLQDRLLGPILGIDDPRTNERIDFVGGIRGASQLERRAGGQGVAFSLFPVTTRQLMAIADAGRIMPPKSTWFEPKLRSGLLVHTF